MNLFAEDRNLFHTSKTYLNAEKTELVIPKSLRKVFRDEIKIKLSGKKLSPLKSIKMSWCNKMSWCKD